MFQYVDSLNINILMVTNEIRPDKSQTNHRRQTCDAVNVAQMSVLDVEPCCLHGAKTCLNLPTLLIGGNGQIRSVVTDDDLKFGNSIRVFQQSTGNIDILAFEKKKLVIAPLLPEFEDMEQMSRTNVLARPWVPQPKILLDTEIISDTHIVEVLYPLFAHELTVGHKRIYAVSSKQTDKSINQLDSFPPIGIAPFIKHGKHQRNGNTLISHAKYENVDVDFTELPVGSVHRKHQSLLLREECEYYFGNQIKIERIMGKKPLHPSEIRITFHRRRHCCRNLVKAYSLHHAKSVNHKSQQFYAGEVHYGAKMLLHNRDDLINFAIVYGSGSNFYGKSGQTFL